ncbi:Lrp/AsnC family transcriptional regulator [Marinivivus vitaminiproducens]|uniref:Lrp/AsnC family transcriptional regulator n=1 Tax=Marinivivus vitaminiproducens TaxID=3035935 RepID=UPI00279BA250|nr:Lrp/AsnC family transcriptional regulator [Geminicoccaceae bacterium SCSIO 64248]
MRVPSVDATSLKILKLLQAEPELTVAEIGERVGLSHTPCWRRIKQMEADGIIKGRVVLLDPDKLDLEVSVLCFVRLKQHDEDTLLAFETAVLDMPDVVQCYSVTGEHDYFLRVLARDVKTYEEVLKKSLLHLPGVAFINSSFTLRELKNTQALPL